MRLKNELSPLYYWQIETQFLDRETVFKNILIQHIKCFEAEV